MPDLHHDHPSHDHTAPDHIAPVDSSAIDAVVIGSGSGGLTAAVGLSRMGKRVLLVERDKMGGDCTNVGCIPSKVLLHRSEEVAVSRREPADDAQFDQAQVAEAFAHVRKQRDDLRHHEEVDFGSIDGITLRYGHARLLAPGRVAIAPEGDDPSLNWQVSVENVVVSTGSAPRRLPIAGLPEDRYLTNEELFELTEAPRHLAIVGAGPVGVEMAVAFRRLGSEVTLLDAADQIMGSLLPEAASVLAASLAEQGVAIRTSRFAVAYDLATETLQLTPAADGPKAPPTEQLAGVDKVLVAIGRVPNNADLGLEDLGVKMTKSGHIETDDRGRTNVDGLWAIGDVATTGGTTHFANAWGRRVVQSIAYPLVPMGDEPERPAVTYTQPEVATIGVQPVKADADVKRIVVDGSKIDRAYTDDVEHSILIVDVRRFTGKILGATVVGPRAGELITTFALAMRADVPFHRCTERSFRIPPTARSWVEPWTCTWPTRFRLCTSTSVLGLRELWPESDLALASLIK